MDVLDTILNSLDVIFITTGIFVAIIVCLAVPPKITKKLIGKLAIFTAFGALGIYGYGFAQRDDLKLGVAVLRATFDVLRVFVGSNDWGEVKGAFTETYQQVFFWLVHLMALFTSASAVITSLGSGLIRKFRLWALRMNDITMIYGLTENTLEFGRELMEKGARSILYVEQNPEKSLPTAVDHMGGILRSDAEALNASKSFLKSIGLKSGKRKINVYALCPDLASNQQYAKRLLESMEALGISAEQTSLTLLGPSDEMDNRFLACSGRYGFGSVISINEPEMVARMLVKHYPPCNVVTFDETGKAVNDFHGLIVGFGQVGQAVLRQLVMNGQFRGNHFRLAVFAPDYQQRMGLLSHECGGMLKNYDISFYAHDGRSCQMYDYAAQHLDTLDYIVICTGSQLTNLEIAEQLQVFMNRRSRQVPIYMCSSAGVAHKVSDDQLILHKIYTADILCSDRIDRMAMVLNHSYTGSGDMLENWRNCGYFNRMSSRAAADYYQAILRMAGVTAEQARKHWSPEGILLENLAAAEHLRWNAFHYSMGFRPMTDAEFEERCEIYREEKKKDPDTKFRIARDMDKRIHGCLIPWEALDTYSARENAVTGGKRDYAENDRINIHSLADVLRAMDEVN